MIVYWCKEEKKNFKNEKEETKTIIYPTSDLDLNNLNSFNSEELNNLYNQNDFFEENPFNEIYNDFDNNNSSDTRSVSTDENKELFENIILNIISSPLNNEKEIDENNIKKEIENFFSENCLIKEEKILQFFNLCQNESLKEFFFQKIIFHLVDLFNNNKNIYEKIYMMITEDQRKIFINEIIKKTPQLIINKNGYKALLFLISFKKENIINQIINSISQNFLFYCLNNYSSEIICILLSTGINFSNIKNQIKENLDFISQNENGMKIIQISRKFHII